MSAIVLDGHLKSALSAVRSLGVSGVTVVCGAERSSAMTCHSKYVQTRFVYTSPKKNQTEFVDEVKKQAQALLARDGEKPVIFCFSDATMCTLAQRYTDLQEYIIISMPSLQSFETAADKQRTYELAQKLQVPRIETYSETEFANVTYPAVVKNRHSIVWKNGVGISGSATFVFSLVELQKVYNAIKMETEESPLVQKFIRGAEFGIEMVCKEGTILASFAHERIRSLSPRGGAAVVKRTAEETPEVVLMRQYATRIVQELVWTGPIMVEFKIDSATREVVLMEINGRFWGSLPLAIKAGVDFPMIAYLQALQKDEVLKLEALEPRHVRTRHFLGDVKWLLAVFFARDKMRPILYPWRLRAWWDFKIEIFRSRGDIFDIHDLKPSFMEYIDFCLKIRK